MIGLYTETFEFVRCRALLVTVADMSARITVHKSCKFQNVLTQAIIAYYLYTIG